MAATHDGSPHGRSPPAALWHDGRGVHCRRLYHRNEHAPFREGGDSGSSGLKRGQVTLVALPRNQIMPPSQRLGGVADFVLMFGTGVWKHCYRRLPAARDRPLRRHPGSRRRGPDLRQNTPTVQLARAGLGRQRIQRLASEQRHRRQPRPAHRDREPKRRHVPRIAF